MSRSDRGFTLIELLLASALILAGAATIATMTAQGIRLFNRLAEASREEEAALGLAKITRDLRNMTAYLPIPFKGAEDRIEFAALEDLAGDGEWPDPSPIRVTYRYDDENLRIVREAVRPQTFERPEATRNETVLRGVRGMRFIYEGEPGQLPRIVTLEIEYGGRSGSQTVTREVPIPSAPSQAEER